MHFAGPAAHPAEIDETPGIKGGCWCFSWLRGGRPRTNVCGGGDAVASAVKRKHLSFHALFSSFLSLLSFYFYRRSLPLSAFLCPCFRCVELWRLYDSDGRFRVFSRSVSHRFIRFNRFRKFSRDFAFVQLVSTLFHTISFDSISHYSDFSTDGSIWVFSIRNCDHGGCYFLCSSLTLLLFPQKLFMLFLLFFTELHIFT